jgi:hypothetical protein
MVEEEQIKQSKPMGAIAIALAVLFGLALGAYGGYAYWQQNPISQPVTQYLRNCSIAGYNSLAHILVKYCSNATVGGIVNYRLGSPPNATTQEIIVVATYTSNAADFAIIQTGRNSINVPTNLSAVNNTK